MTKDYFNKLNYTLANEDTEMELQILPEGVSRVIAVAGSGARVLPLFARSPATVTCVDLSMEQLWLTELRIETARILSHDDFLQFWGYPPKTGSAEHRRRVMSELMISDSCRNFFRSLFEETDWSPILYCGRWEQTFGKISKVCRRVLGSNIEELFASETIAEHADFMSKHFASLRWDLLVFILGNSAFFNAMLYGGHFPQKNTSGSHRSFYKAAYQRIFSAGLPHENFFLQLTMFGEIKYPQGNPVECRPEVYAALQAGIRRSKIEYANAGVVEFIGSQSDKPAGFVSLSDVPSYFDNATAVDFLQQMNSGLSRDALVVSRYYLRVLKDMNMAGFESVTEKFIRWIELEKTQMYDVGIYRKI